MLHYCKIHALSISLYYKALILLSGDGEFERRPSLAMSIHDQAVVAVLEQLAMVADGALVGLALAYVAVRSILNFKANSSALHKINDAPSLRVSDLRSLLSSSESNVSSESSNQPVDGKLVIIRGTVEAKSAVEGNWKSLRANVLSAHNSAEKGVIWRRTQTCIYNEWRGFFWWTGDLHSIFPRLRKDQESSSLRMVPFVLVESGKWPQPNVNVNMDGSSHPLPLVTVYHHLQPVNATPLTFIQTLFGHQYPVGVLDEEKILPLGKDITAVGVCSSKDGIFEIKSCKDLPYFLSDMTKDQMLVHLAFKSKVLLWSGVVLGSVAVGVLGYAVVR
ncbi:hypothetical protein HAX54_013014 [Datura stramonium]|uniref:RING-type E3 ubiquitin transferase n=1 Tax=Datura stramonium TaxID=4076 RepID=A0ABS8Y2W3_DATST|nr:hypothetical protein [Datura stramonium]